MVKFEPQISGDKSDQFANCSKTTASEFVGLPKGLLKGKN